jgi:outer membrane protein assembly factor BamB
VVALHRAVAESVWVHHANGTQLPTKDGQLDWSLGAGAVQALRERTGADYALFTWVRDSYASSERKAVMVGMLLLGSVTLGGNQAGYASLVDLKTGRVVWFRDLDRMWGDLREPQPAAETVDALLEGFPEAK